VCTRKNRKSMNKTIGEMGHLVLKAMLVMVGLKYLRSEVG